ncbi:hypothetical protein ACFFJB_00865 [Camelimonas abortus]|uniref:Nitrate reductase n=1 Tax=Camelimonas abortus TaxID=1017184 RepID=A0ABV7LAG1_9HYPH
MTPLWFGRKSAPGRELRERVSAWASAAHGGEARFSVNEISCRDPACPGVETVILVMEPGVATRAVKIARPMAEVTEDDVRAALAAPDRDS